MASHAVASSECTELESQGSWLRVRKIKTQAGRHEDAQSDQDETDVRTSSTIAISFDLSVKRFCFDELHFLTCTAAKWMALALSWRRQDGHAVSVLFSAGSLILREEDDLKVLMVNVALESIYGKWVPNDGRMAQAVAKPNPPRMDCRE